MKISKRSWHYRLVNWFCSRIESPVPDNLCEYIYVLGLSLGYWIVLIIFFPIVLLGFVLLLIPFGLFVGGKLVFDWLVGESKQSLLMAWLKAKKHKVCPFIEFVDE